MKKAVIAGLLAASLLGGQALASQTPAILQRAAAPVGETEEAGTTGLVLLFAAAAAAIVVGVEATEQDQPTSP